MVAKREWVAAPGFRPHQQTFWRSLGATVLKTYFHNRTSAMISLLLSTTPLRLPLHHSHSRCRTHAQFDRQCQLKPRRMSRVQQMTPSSTLPTCLRIYARPLIKSFRTASTRGCMRAITKHFNHLQCTASINCGAVQRRLQNGPHQISSKSLWVAVGAWDELAWGCLTCTTRRPTRLMGP